MSVYSDQQIRDLFRAGESQTVEFKTDIHRPDILSRLICAFANAEGGVILIGVDERRGFIGCNSAKMMRMFDEARHRLRDASSASMYFHSIDGVEIAVLRVAKSPRMVSTVDGVFIRRGEATVAMAPDEMLRMLTPEPAKSEIQDLIEVVSGQTRVIDELRKEIREGRSWKNRIKEVAIGFAIGCASSFVIWILTK